MKRVMVFGTFDTVHDGHRHLLHEAAELGHEVIVVVTRDEHVLELKGKLPENVLADRMEEIACESEVTEVIPSDEELGMFNVIATYEPDVLLLGYDQDELYGSLQAWMEEASLNIPITFASTYQPDVFGVTSLAEQMDEEEVLL